MIGRMILLAIAMVLGLSAVLIGVIVIAVEGEVAIGAAVAGLGLVAAPWCLVRIVRLNRKYQADALAAVLADPSQILARWPSAAGEVILARGGLFVGPSYHTFAAGYQRLLRASLDGGELVLVFLVVGAEAEVSRRVAVPEAAMAAVKEFVARRS